jgi:hypothetical protein
MSISFHPQTDSQIERINQMIEVYLSSFINYKMDNWVRLLPMAEFAYNNSVTQATGILPFFANDSQYLGCTNPTTISTSDSIQEGYINHIASVQALVLTGGSLVTDGRVTQFFRKEKMRSNNSNDGN